MGLNKAMLIGNLGQDPELRYTGSGQAVLSLRLATNEKYKDRDGEWKDMTEWHTVVIWGKRAEGLSRVVSKGTQLYIEGRLQTRSWEDKQGQKRYTTEIVVKEVVLLGGSKGGGGESRGNREGRGAEDSGRSRWGDGDGGGYQSGGGYQGGGGGHGAEDDEIPF